ncbi:MAG TPA: cyanase [Luteolibacter sp.]
MTKLEMTEAIFIAKAAKNRTWAEIASAVGLSEVFVTSACLGQNSLSAAEAAALCEFLGLPPIVATALTLFPTKGVGTAALSSDPLLYRFHEINLVYGPTIKELIHEKFGDGIMSAIDFTLEIDKQEDPKGDRVVVTMNGKFLPYKKW